MGNKVTILDSNYTRTNTVMTIRCNGTIYTGVVHAINRHKNITKSITLLLSDGPAKGLLVDIDFDRSTATIRAPPQEVAPAADAGSIKSTPLYPQLPAPSAPPAASTERRLRQHFRNMLDQIVSRHTRMLNDRIRAFVREKTAWQNEVDLPNGRGWQYLPLQYRYLYGNLKRGVLQMIPRTEKNLYDILHYLTITSRDYVFDLDNDDPTTLLGTSVETAQDVFRLMDLSESRPPMNQECFVNCPSGVLTFRFRYNGDLLDENKCIQQAKRGLDLPYFYTADPLVAIKSSDGQRVDFGICLGREGEMLRVWFPIDSCRDKKTQLSLVKETDLVRQWMEYGWYSNVREWWEKRQLGKVEVLRGANLDLDDIQERMDNVIELCRQKKFGFGDSNGRLFSLADVYSDTNTQGKIGYPMMYRDQNDRLVVHIIRDIQNGYVMAINPFDGTETKVPNSAVVPLSARKLVSMPHLVEWIRGPRTDVIEKYDARRIETIVGQFLFDQSSMWKAETGLQLKINDHYSVDLLQPVDKDEFEARLRKERELCGGLLRCQIVIGTSADNSETE